jgi:hypothetical protein
MSYPDDPRRAEAQAMPIGDIVAKLDLQGLQRTGHEMVGPCPVCGGRDRFGVNLRKGVFQCRRCDGKGGGIDLVMFALNLTFPQALDWLCGAKSEISDEERARRARLAEENRLRQQRIAEKKRAEAVADAKRIWRECRPPEDSPVRDYLALRGFGRDRLPSIPASLRFHPDLPFMQQVDGAWREIHRGPAMVAGIQGPDHGLCAVHRTWIDLDRPKGKARIVHPVTGDVLPAKKVLGHKKGCAIRLSHLGRVLVMGEGIETTLTALVAGALPDAGYWAGIDLGNMAGRRETGKGLKFAGRPDLDDDEAFVPPPQVERLVYIMDGDSDPKDTRAKLEAGLRRAMVLRPGLRGQIVHAGQGRDLNDVLLGEGDDE